MIKKLKLHNFTLFRKACVEFSSGLNVIIGSNGTGKSHLLKLAYCASRWQSENVPGPHSSRPDKATLQKELGGKLLRVFRPDQLGRLSSRHQGRERSEVSVSFFPLTENRRTSDSNFTFSFASNSKTDVTLDKSPKELLSTSSVFLPTKEMLSLFPGFIALYEGRQLTIDETYADLCRALELPLLKGPRFKQISQLLDPLQDLLGGKIVNEGGRFYLSQAGAGKFEIPLVAEGFRKIGTIAYLLANGTLRDQSLLIWDEPETNLNAAYLQKVAEFLTRLAKSGTQVIIGTHSLFLMRELSMLNADGSARFFALSEREAEDLSASWDRRSTAITQGSSADDIEPIAALDAELDQSDRYLESQD